MVRTLTKSLVSTLVCLALAAPAWAQAQAANGNIEGVVRDASGGVLPGVLVTVINTDTGAQRTATTNDDGVYRALLMPLGAFLGAGAAMILTLLVTQMLGGATPTRAILAGISISALAAAATSFRVSTSHASL